MINKIISDIDKRNRLNNEVKPNRVDTPSQ